MADKEGRPMAANPQSTSFARQIRQWRRSRQWLLIAGGVCTLGVSTLVAGGCFLLEAPPPEPIPTPPPTPLPDVFDAKDFISAVPTAVPLNVAEHPTLPDAFRVVRVLSGELVSIQSVDTPPPPTPPPAPPGAPPAPPPAPPKPRSPISGAPEVVRLAGILAAPPGQPGAGEAMLTIQRWTLGQNVTVEQDSRYPVDDSGRRRVQIFFTGHTDNPATPDLDEGKVPTTYLLNRMLVRSGYAVVDINEPTAFDTKGWLNDEAYARQHKKGLWGRNIILGRRPGYPRQRVTTVLKQTVTDRTVRPGAKPAATRVPSVIR